MCAVVKMTPGLWRIERRTLKPDIRGSLYVQEDEVWLESVNKVLSDLTISRFTYQLKIFRVGQARPQTINRQRLIFNDQGPDRHTSGPSWGREIASSLGYESESAFGKAFKRVMGCSPRHYKVQRFSIAQS